MTAREDGRGGGEKGVSRDGFQTRPYPFSQRPMTDPERPPCAGCPHLYARVVAGGAVRPECGQGVEYGQPGCRVGAGFRKRGQYPFPPIATASQPPREKGSTGGEAD